MSARLFVVNGRVVLVHRSFAKAVVVSTGLRSALLVRKICEQRPNTLERREKESLKVWRHVVARVNIKIDKLVIIQEKLSALFRSCTGKSVAEGVATRGRTRAVTVGARDP